jgi:WD40 repeat protein
MKNASRNLIVVSVLVGAFIISGCNSPTSSSHPDTKATKLPLPEGEYWGVAWLDGWIVFESPTTEGQSNFHPSRLWKVREDGKGLEMLELSDSSICGLSGSFGFEDPIQLPDGQLGYSILCRSEHLVFMAYDLNTGKNNQLPGFEMPYFFFGVHPTWNPEMTEGMAFADNRTSSWVFGFSLEDWEPLDLGFPQVSGMAWSPDGTKIAFLAAPTQGLSGMSLVDSTFNLYTMKPDGQDMHVILKNIYHPNGLMWSQDGKYLIFNGTTNRASGLWLLNMTTNELMFVYQGYFALGGWSPDGNRFLVSRAVGTDGNQDEILILDLSDFIN